MYRFLLRPRWLVSHVLILALIITMVNLGFWQLRRLDEKKDLNAKIVSRINAPVADLAEVIRGVDTAAESDRVDYRSTTVEGTYLVDDEILVPGRNDGPGPGQWVATPLRTDAGQVVLVLRGAIPAAIDAEAPPVNEVAPPSGRVRIEGWVRRSERRPNALAPADARIDGRRFNRLDVPRIAEVLEQDLLPVVVQVKSQEPATQSELISPIPLPELTEGSHLSYAVQWYIFSLIAIGGYPMVLRRVARRAAARADGEASGAGPGGDEPEPGGSDGSRSDSGVAADPVTQPAGA